LGLLLHLLCRVSHTSDHVFLEEEKGVT